MVEIDINETVDSIGNSIFSYAVIANSVDLVEYIVKVVVKEEELESSARIGDLKIAYKENDWKQSTSPLFLAMIHLCYDVIDVLLNPKNGYRIDINAKDIYGRTLFMLAARTRSIGLLNFLFESYKYEMKPFEEDKNGRSIYSFASRALQVSEFLEKVERELNQIDNIRKQSKM